MLIQKLKITGFRGVPGTLELNLGAKISIIYAPNGTGKTTICDAAEWLLTGKIDRIHNQEADDIRCRFSESQNFTSISGDMDDGKPYTLLRTIDGLKFSLDGRKFRKFDNSELHNLVAPSVKLSLRSTGRTNTSTNKWIIGARFLAGNTLTLLLDDNEDAESKSQLFADMFGLNEYRTKEAKLGRFQKALPPLKSLGEKITKAQSLLAAHKQQLATNIDKIKTYLKPALHQRLSQFYECLHLAIPAELLQDEAAAISAALDLAAQQSAKVEQGRRALAQLSDIMPRLPEVLTTLQGLETQEKELIKNLLAKGVEVDSIGSEIKRISLQSMKLKSLLYLYDKILPLKEELVLTISSISEIIYSSGSLADIPEKTRSTLQKQSLDQLTGLSELDKQIKDASNILSNWSHISEKIQKKWTIESAIKSLQLALLNTDEEKQHREDLAALKQQLRICQSEEESLSGPYDKLQSVLTAIRRFEPHSSLCPACRHDWITPEVLDSAIAAALGTIPDILAKETARIVELQDKIQRCEAQLAKQEMQESKLCALQAECEQLTASINALSTTRNLLMLPRDVGLIDEEKRQIAEVLASDIHKRSSLASEQIVTNDLTAKLAKVSSIAGHLLVIVAEQISDDKIDYNELLILSNICTELISEKMNLADLVRLKDEILFSREKMINFRTHLLVQQTEFDSNRKLLDAKKGLTHSAHDKIKKDHELLEGRIVALRESLTSAKAAWRLLDDQLEFNPQLFDDLFERISNRNKGVEIAIHSLRIAENLQVEINGLSGQITDSAVRDAEGSLRAAEQDYAKWKQVHDITNKAIAEIHDFVQISIDAQLEEFGETISTLYYRTQGNSVFDQFKIKTTQTENEKDIISWLANCGENTLRVTNLSQGQRQNLALSIFLARARSIGGTFFMDEPFAHLDELNRVAILDILRVLALEPGSNFRLVITTASRRLVRLMQEKFNELRRKDSLLLRVLELSGGPRDGVECSEWKDSQRSEAVPSLQ